MMERAILYYGYPIAINSVWNVETASDIFAEYDIYVVGDGYQDPTHEQWQNSKDIIGLTKQKNPDIQIFGYVQIGMDDSEGSNLTIEEVQIRVQQWVDMGATGNYAR